MNKKEIQVLGIIFRWISVLSGWLIFIYTIMFKEEYFFMGFACAIGLFIFGGTIKEITKNVK